MAWHGRTTFLAPTTFLAEYAFLVGVKFFQFSYQSLTDACLGHYFAYPRVLKAVAKNKNKKLTPVLITADLGHVSVWSECDHQCSSSVIFL